MKQHRQSTAAMALMTVAAFIVTAWANSAAADEPAGTAWALSEQGFKFDVFRSQNNRPDHQGALIYVVQTRKKSRINPNVKNAHGLAFVQTTEQAYGEGFVCELSSPIVNDRSFECHIKIGGIKETLTVGAIGSTFCNNLWQEIKTCVDKHPDRKKYLYTSEKENPVATPGECTAKYGTQGTCVCFDIRHDDSPVCLEEDEGPGAPPNSGSGTGGHN